MLNSETIKRRAAELGCDVCGIGDVRLFEGCPENRDPRRILPDATCIIGFGFRVPKALYETMGRGIQYYNYTSLGVKYIDEEFAEMLLLRMAAMIENEGYDACVQRNTSNIRVKGDKSQNPELYDTYELTHATAVAQDKPVPDIIIDFAYAARVCGLGSASVKGTVLTPEFGPYVRFAYIVTDAPLDCDKPFEGSLCDGCMACAKACPGHAIDEGGLDSWQCSVYYRGGSAANPYIKREDFADLGDMLAGEKRFDSQSARAVYPRLDFLPHAINGYVGCLCGKACDRACYEHLERSKALCRK